MWPLGGIWQIRHWWELSLKSNICFSGVSSSVVRNFSGGARGKETACQCRSQKRCGFDPWVGKIPWRRAWPPSPGFLPGEPPWTEEPGEYSPRGRKESDATEATWHASAQVRCGSTEYSLSAALDFKPVSELFFVRSWVHVLASNFSACVISTPETAEIVVAYKHKYSYANPSVFDREFVINKCLWWFLNPCQLFRNNWGCETWNSVSSSQANGILTAGL